MAEKKPRTIGELRKSGYKVLSVKEEMRKNLIDKIRSSTTLFEGILGFEESVIPQVENAVLSGQDMVLLGERGQAKSRIARSLVNLLDREIPYIEGCEISDDPYGPICLSCRTAVAERGDNVAIAWLPKEKRYSEKLATPDITIADLIGEVDPIKVAEGRYLSDELTIHYGLIPRTNRGIFCINELPDLAERIQVGLLNIMEERDVQIRGYKIRLPLDLYVVASANPEDYTNRGRIITPLKDRCGSEIRTHYPRDPIVEIDIVEQERTRFVDAGLQATIPDFMQEIVAEITHLARRSPDINQRSGVSVRVSITNSENILSNAVRRSIRLNEDHAVPRISDLTAILASTAGKIELETAEEGREEHIIDKLIQTAVLNVFNHHFRVQDLEPVVASFDQGVTLEASEFTRSRDYQKLSRRAPGLLEAAEKVASGKSPAALASAIEFVLEGLYLSRKLNKEKVSGKAQYRGHHAFL